MLTSMLFPQRPVKRLATSIETAIKEIIMSLANGNVSLQFGQFISRDQMDEQKKSFTKYKFN